MYLYIYIYILIKDIYTNQKHTHVYINQSKHNVTPPPSSSLAVP